MAQLHYTQQEMGVGCWVNLQKSSNGKCFWKFYTFGL